MTPRMRRRDLAGLVAALPGTPESFLLTANGWVPNNARLPVLLYRGVMSGAGEIETLLRRNQWEPQWRNGVYPFHHYHSTAHEVLGFASGEARILLGGPLPGGREVTVRAGDIAVLPCGTGHCLVDSSSGFLVVGAYGLGQSWDLCRGAPTDVQTRTMAKLPFPAADPVHGAGGPLTKLWKG
ncbi:MAG: cupin [Acidobacteria bacterium]|nr:cupin [Acidobacteriota bacterium]